MIFTVNIHNTTELPCRLYSEHSCHEYVFRIPIMAKKQKELIYLYLVIIPFKNLKVRLFMIKQKCNSNNTNGNLAKSSLTLNEWYSFWIQNYKTGVVKPSTIQNYCCIYNNHIKKFLGYMPLCEIRTMHIQQMHNSLGLSSKYQHRIHAILSNMFEIAVQNDLIVKNPCCGTKLQSLQNKHRRVLSSEEQQLFANLMQQPKWRDRSLPITVLLGTGIRVGELLALTWDNIDLKQKTIYIEKTLLYLWNTDLQKYTFSFQSPKTVNSKRCIPMSTPVHNAFLQQCDKIKQLKQNSAKWSPIEDFENLVFVNSLGRPMQRRDIQIILDRMTDELNKQALKSSSSYYIKHIHPHTLRHSFATRCFEVGIPPKVVQTLLGHSSIQITMDLYTHVSSDMCRENMKKLEKFGM